MRRVERKLLSSDDLKELYRVTGPKIKPEQKLYMVIRRSNTESWTIESKHQLKGYRACKINLGARVRQYEEKLIWPEKCELGIGVFEGEALCRILVASDNGYKKVKESPISLPLDGLLSMTGLTRKDIKVDQSK
jgi:hypothetical protein